MSLQQLGELGLGVSVGMACCFLSCTSSYTRGILVKAEWAATLSLSDLAVRNRDLYHVSDNN